MPLTPTYNWSETADSVLIDIPGITLKDPAQLFTSDCCLKLNAAPYLLVLDLHDYVDVKGSRALLKRNAIHVELVKVTPGTWGALVAQGSSKELQARRAASIQRKYDADVAEAQQRLEQKKQAEKDASERRIDEDRRKRLQLEAAKAAELAAERSQLEAWKAGLAGGPAAAAAAAGGRAGPGAPSPDATAYHQQLLQRDQQGDESDYESEGEEEEAQQQQQAAGASSGAPVADQQAAGREEDHPDYYGKGHRSHSERSSGQQGQADIWDGDHPAPAAGEELVSVVPSHASSDNSSMMQDLLSVGANSAQPTQQALEGPGSSTHPTSEPPDLLTARQSTRISSSSSNAAGGSHQGPQQQAAPVPVPPPPPAAPVRAALACVPVSFTELETPHLPAREAREEELRAYKQQQVAAAAEVLGDSQSMADRQPVFLKDKADALYRQGNYRGALNAYSRALQLDPGHLQLNANRAACYLALGDAAAAVDDCTTALELLRARHAWAAPKEAGQGEEAVAVSGQQQREEEGAGQQPQEPGQQQEVAAPVEVLQEEVKGQDNRLGEMDGQVEDSQQQQDAGEEAQQAPATTAAADAVVAVGGGVCMEDAVAAAAQQEAEEAAALEAAAAQAAGPDNPMADMVAAQQGKGNKVIRPPPPAASSSQRRAVVDPEQVARQLLLRLLTRRAAGYVELGQLGAAEGDLREALRFDRDNAQLAADLAEVQEAAAPLDAAGLKARGAARFKSGDVEGALAAYQLLLQLPEDQATPGERCAALSNISACRLALRQYTSAIQDCTAALQQLLDTAAAAGVPTTVAAAVEQGAAAEQAAAGGEVLGYARLLVQQAVAAATADSSRSGSSASPAVAGANDAGSCAAAGQAAAAAPPVVTEMSDALRGQLQSMVKLLGRMAVACGYLKRGAAAGVVYTSAEGVAQVAGLQALAVKMQQERQQLAAHLQQT